MKFNTAIFGLWTFCTGGMTSLTIYTFGNVLPAYTVANVLMTLLFGSAAWWRWRDIHGDLDRYPI